MTSAKTIKDLQKAVERLIKRRGEIDVAESRIPASNPQKRAQKRTLQRLGLELLSEKNALQIIIRERRAASVTIPPLTEAQVRRFKKAMEAINQVIKADQTFDAIVAVAKGVVAASEKIDDLTDDIPETEEA